MAPQTKSFDSAYPQSNGNTVTGGFTKREIMAKDILSAIIIKTGSINIEDAEMAILVRSAVNTANYLILYLNANPAPDIPQLTLSPIPT